MFTNLEWYQIVVGILFVVALLVKAPFIRLGKMLAKNVKEMWRDPENPDPLWAKVVQTLFFPGYILIVAWLLFNAFSLGVELLNWRRGTLLSCSVLLLLALVIWGIRKLEKHFAAKRRKEP